MRRLSLWLVCWALGLAQDLQVRDGMATLVLESPRPVDSAASFFAEKFGIAISAEDPWYLYSGDRKDVTAEVVRTPRPGLRVFVPMGGRVLVRYAASSDGRPKNVRAALQSVVDAANAQFPFAFQLRDESSMFVFVPTRKRNEAGLLIDAPALLDRKVTIPAGTRKILEHGRLLAEALSASSGFRVSCCQASIGGYPWGMESVRFEATGETARSVLLRLMAQAGRSVYTQKCDPVNPGRYSWCFINVAPLGGSPQK